MNSEWPMVAVDEVCELIVDCVNKTAPVADERTPYRMIRTTNVRNGRIDLTDCKHVDYATYEKWTRRATLKRGDVVLTREAPIGEVGYVADPDGVFLGQRLMQYRANGRVLDSRFLLYAFLSPNLQAQFGSHEGSGSVVSHIRVGDCFKFKLKLPTLPEQKRIADLLGALDDRIALLRETNATLEAIAQALFKSWFVDFDPVRAKKDGRIPQDMDEATIALFPNGLDKRQLREVPHGWRIEKFGVMCSYLNRGLSPKYVDEGGVLVLNQKCVRDFAVDFTKGRRHDPAQRKIDGRELVVGDVLVNSTGVGTLGRVAQLLHLPERCIADSHVTVVRAGPQLTWPYLGQLLKQMQPEIEAMGEGSTGQTELSRSKLGDLPILVPSPEVLARFDAAVLPLKQRVSIQTQQAQTLATLRDTLLPRLISGQLRVPEIRHAAAEAIAV
jgi:type I restriction enzyme S subunit